MPQAKVKILIVEDDAVLGYVVKDFLQKQNFEVMLCTDGDEAWRLFMKHNYDVCLLDVVLPGKKNGLILAKNIRSKNKDIPILMLSSRSMDGDRILGFEAGADDYITKPYNLQVLTMRINVFIKRIYGDVEEQVCGIHKIGDFEFDHSNLVLKSNTEQHQLTVKEADLVLYLCQNANRLIKREDILTNIWGKDDFFLGRSMDVFITKIRKYFKSQNEIKLQTVHGIGYKFINKYVA
jgi:DNA-binding response OmpR family regulator